MTLPRTLRSSAFLLAAVPFFGIATGALFPIVALRLEELGLPKGLVGAATSLYYVGALLGAVTYGAVIRRVGYRAGFAGAALIAAAATLGLTASEDAAAWLVLRLAGGYALGAYYATVDSWVQALGDRSTRGTLFAIYETIRLAATAVGPALLIWGVLQQSLLLVAAAYVVAILPAWLNPPPEEARLKRFDWHGMAQIARCLPLPLVVAFCGGAANASFYGLSAIYAGGIGLAPATLALFVACVLVAPAIVGVPLGALADRTRRMAVAAGCAAVALTVALLLASLGTPPVWLSIGGGMVVGGLLVPLYALGLSRMTDAVGETDALAAATAGLLAYNLGAFAGPAVTGVAMQAVGPIGLYASLATVAAIAAAAALADLAPGRCCAET
ncbi:MAG: MFS transporter [Pseudomonadota bacterium]